MEHFSNELVNKCEKCSPLFKAIESANWKLFGHMICHPELTKSNLLSTHSKAPQPKINLEDEEDKEEIVLVHENKKVQTFFKCSKCGFKNESKTTTRRHISRSHPGESIQLQEETIYRCFLCKINFPTRCQLMDHKKITHQNVDSIKCPLCNRNFITTMDLVVHIQIVHPKASPDEETIDSDVELIEPASIVQQNAFDLNETMSTNSQSEQVNNDTIFPLSDISQIVDINESRQSSISPPTFESTPLPGLNQQDQQNEQLLEQNSFQQMNDRETNQVIEAGPLTTSFPSTQNEINQSPSSISNDSNLINAPTTPQSNFYQQQQNEQHFFQQVNFLETNQGIVVPLLTTTSASTQTDNPIFHFSQESFVHHQMPTQSTNTSFSNPFLTPNHSTLIHSNDLHQPISPIDIQQQTLLTNGPQNNQPETFCSSNFPEQVMIIFVIPTTSGNLEIVVELKCYYHL